jgi:hypothetical protein
MYRGMIFRIGLPECRSGVQKNPPDSRHVSRAVVFELFCLHFEHPAVGFS